MRRHWPLISWMLGCLGLVAFGVLWTHEANVRERSETEAMLSMQSQVFSRNVDAYKPEYTDHLQRVVAGNPRHLRVLLYDLSGWEIGRRGGSGAAIPLNQTAARLAAARSLRPTRGETPLPSFEGIPPEVASHPRIFNRLYASNIIGGAWVETMKSNVGDQWLVATTTVNDYDSANKRTFISAWLQAAMRMEDVERMSRQRWWRLGGVTTLATGLFALWWLWTTRQCRAVQSIASAAERIPIDRIHGLRLDVPEESPDAARLVRACNRLIDKVGEVHLAQQRFVADAAHELRTPLAILRGEIQVALREPANHPFLIETLRSNLEESVHLSKLVDSLLTLVRSDAGQSLAPRQPVDLAVMAQQTLSKLEPLAAGRNVRLEFLGPEPTDSTRLEADPLAVDRILFNLTENAVKHSPPGYPVTVAIETSATHLKITVTDRGVGIAPEHLPRLFGRFYRVDSARRRVDGGVGLGLSMVKALAEAHGGTVGVTSEIGVGSVFTVVLPRSGTVAHR